MQNRKASAPTWSKVIFVLLYIAAVVSVGLYVAIHGNLQFGWGIPFEQWAEASGLQVLYRSFLLPNGLYYFVVIPALVVLFWGMIVLLLKSGAKKRLPPAQQEEEPAVPRTEEPEEVQEEPSVPQTEEPEAAPSAEDEEMPAAEMTLEESVPEPEQVPAVARRLSAEEIREIYRSNGLLPEKKKPEEPYPYLSDLYYQNREEEYQK